MNFKEPVFGNRNASFAHKSNRCESVLLGVERFAGRVKGAAKDER